MHFCQDEAAALAGVLSSIGLAWTWLKARFRGWRQARKDRAERDKAFVKYCTEMSDAHRHNGALHGVYREHDLEKKSNVETLEEALAALKGDTR